MHKQWPILSNVAPNVKRALHFSHSGYTESKFIFTKLMVVHENWGVGFSRFSDTFFLSLRQEKDELDEKLGVFQAVQTHFFMELCPIQDPIRFQARHFGRKTAELLVDPQGELDVKNLKRLQSYFSDRLYCLGPRRETDTLIREHILSCLEKLSSEPGLWPLIRKISPPFCHKKAEEYIQRTFWQPGEPFWPRITARASRVAALSSWLTWLRQITGSCFATAPAILVQKQNPFLFFTDLYDLFSTGELKRVIQGHHYTVPLAPSLGNGDLEKPLFGGERLELCPGFRIACEAASFFPNTVLQEEKESYLKNKLSKLQGKKNIGQVLSTLLKETEALTDEEIEEEETFKKVQISPLIGQGMFYERPSLRAEKIARWKKKCSLAETAFLSLVDCATLRSWEYSIASFSDAKLDFSRWNLHVGLGLHPDQKGGLADFLHGWMSQKLHLINQEIQREHEEYVRASQAVQAAQALLQQAYQEGQIHRLKADITAAFQAADQAMQRRDAAQKKGDALAHFFPDFLEQCDKALSQNFQEVFDPSVGKASQIVYEDSPAGFRLLYKHGRTKAHTWSFVQNSENYIESLINFFRLFELDIRLPPFLESSFLSELITALLSFIQSSAFLSGAMGRAQTAGKKSPWDYFSGGTMQSLVQIYFSKGRPPQEEIWNVRAPEELIGHLFEKKGSSHPFLMHSPTHAFIFEPKLLLRDAEKAIRKNRQFIERLGQKADDTLQEFFAGKIEERLSEAQRPLFAHLIRSCASPFSRKQMKENLKEALQSMRIPETGEWVDSILYEQGVVLTPSQADQVASTCIERLSLKLTIPFFSQSKVGGLDLFDALLSAVNQTIRGGYSRRDFASELRLILADLEILYPHPLFFADTNWSGWLFGWIFNPVEARWELWRLNRLGLKGFPMNGWNVYTSNESSAPWILLNRPEEYGLNR